MMIDQNRIRIHLRFIVCTITSQIAFHDDLFQEALIHIWRKELAFPGQTEAYYFQSCRCHMIDYLRRGRSIDAPKRTHGRCNEDGLTEENDSESSPTYPVAHEDTVSSVSVRDMLNQLLPLLDELGQAVLQHLAEGVTARDIAQKFGLTHQAVSKRRRKIAATARQLGIHP